MKNRVLLLVVVAFFVSVIFILKFNSNEFRHLERGIFVKEGSAQYDNGRGSAVFKVKNSENFSYKIVKYEASCDEEKLLKQISAFEYDKNGNLINADEKETIYHNFEDLTDDQNFYNEICKIHKYDELNTVQFQHNLCTDKKTWSKLSLNKQGDVLFDGKVLLNEKGMPLNDMTSYTYCEIKTLVVASGTKPHAGCNPDDTENNGIYGLGCYIDRE